MQLTAMIVSVIVSAIVSYLIARQRLSYTEKQAKREQLHEDQELFAKWIVYTNDMMAALSIEDDQQEQRYRTAERHLEEQLALIGLEYHQSKYDDLIDNLRSFIKQARMIKHQELGAIDFDELMHDQRVLNKRIRAIIAQQNREIIGK